MFVLEFLLCIVLFLLTIFYEYSWQDREKKGKRLDKLLQKRDKLQKEEYVSIYLKYIRNESQLVMELFIQDDNETLVIFLH